MIKTKTYATVLALPDHIANDPALCMGAIATYLEKYARDARRALMDDQPYRAVLHNIETKRVVFGVEMTLTWKCIYIVNDDITTQMIKTEDNKS